MVPFDEATTEYQAPLGVVFDTQVVPEFEDVKIDPNDGPKDPVTNLVPSAEEATDQGEVEDGIAKALVVQVAPSFEEV